VLHVITTRLCTNEDAMMLHRSHSNFSICAEWIVCSVLHFTCTVMYSSFSVQQEARENVLLQSAVLRVQYGQYLELAYRQIIQIAGMLVFRDVNQPVYLRRYLLASLLASLFTDLTHLPCFLPYLFTYLLTSLFTYLTHLLASFLTYLLTYVLTYFLTYLRTYALLYLRTYALTCFLT